MDSSTSHTQPLSPVPAVPTGSKLLRAFGGLLMLLLGGCLLGGCLLASAVVAGRDGQTVLAASLAVPSLPLLFYLGAVLVGRMPAGGVYLTPTAVVDSHSGHTVRVAWDDLVGIRVDSPIALIVRPGSSVQHTRTAPRGWRGGVRAPEGLVGIEVRQLREDPAVVGFLVEAYRERADLRDQLGTAASLEWQILREDS